MEEIWLDVKDYENKYLVSNLGRVKNKKTGRCLSQYINDSGYSRVTLSGFGRSNQYGVHQLVASAFCKKTKSKTEVNHIDEDKSNNVYTNLQWVTKRQNLIHGTRIKRIVDKNSIPVIKLDKNGNYLSKYKSASTAGKANGVSPSSITRVCKGKSILAGGFKWEYYKELVIKNKYINNYSDYLYEGMVILNYKSACYLFGEKNISHNTKHLEHWKKYFNYERDGQKIIIKRIKNK